MVFDQKQLTHQKENTFLSMLDNFQDKTYSKNREIAFEYLDNRSRLMSKMGAKLRKSRPSQVH